MTKGERRKKEIYNFIASYIDEVGLPPSMREICEGVGLKSTSTVFLYLHELEEEGLLRTGVGRKRALALPDGGPGRRTVPVPIVGKVTAGAPILAVEDALGALPVDRDFARGRELFALTVRGDSMVDAAILDGDLVVVERTPTAENGDIVVALIEDEATVKRFYKEQGHFRLQPENKAYEPIIVEELAVLGKVIGVWREM
ncbi:MAG TPA: transcriptional repressor LexA [Candidatus Acidoferrum sp.]|nr:transcriptional repressor LexA [Candidatus Acidoferrum sp.]